VWKLRLISVGEVKIHIIMKQTLYVAILLPIILNTFAVSASAQSTEFTYQGRVLDNGANFTGLGQFQFALVTSTNISAQATAAALSPLLTSYQAAAVTPARRTLRSLAVVVLALLPSPQLVAGR
jgi:hypothetical protein